VVDVEVGAGASVGDDVEDELDVDVEGAAEGAPGPRGVERSLPMVSAGVPPWRTVRARVGRGGSGRHRCAGGPGGGVSSSKSEADGLSTTLLDGAAVTRKGKTSSSKTT
jgi:hypothetical protein